MTKLPLRSKLSPKIARVLAIFSLSLTATVLAPTSVAAQSVQNCFGITPAIAQARGFTVRIGTNGNDVINGSANGKSFILGLGGNDVLNGGGAGDIICGGSGNDTINAGGGHDRAFGGPGADLISLGAGGDIGAGGSGNDRVVGGTGHDQLHGQDGNDRLSGENGNDEISGGGGDDTVFGGFGADSIRGHAGDDSLAGGPGGDVIFGMGGNDTISGDAGNDRILGGPGNDYIDGDAGRDVIIGHGGVDRCDTADGDSTNCENTFATTVATPAAQSAPTGSAVPASQAPQGVNRYGWPLLTNAGLAAMLHCESTTNHAINTGNGFYGGVQWLPNTWNAAARLSGYNQYDGVLPHLVPAGVQDQVTKDWWAATAPNTQWPTCHKVALEAMNVLAP